MNRPQESAAECVCFTVQNALGAFDLKNELLLSKRGANKLPTGVFPVPTFLISSHCGACCHSSGHRWSPSFYPPLCTLLHSCGYRKRLHFHSQLTRKCVPPFLNWNLSVFSHRTFLNKVHQIECRLLSTLMFWRYGALHKTC